MIIKISLIYKEVPECEQDEHTCLANSLAAAVLICILLFTGAQEEQYLIPKTQKLAIPIWLSEGKKYCRNTNQ